MVQVSLYVRPTSIGSHNIDDGALLECCRSPAMSAAVSACLKD
ncbi:hypothetical protein ACHAXA_004369 [Cyclostephanos tholiformis]|uniref:Uncharacterized protein n=1 Tax=Cyclostephanos tholiformis TaxID=382380 RepID=A0ABD3RG49_9STRA